MSQFESLTMVGGLLLSNFFVLLLFKKIFLNRFRSNFLQYTLGMFFAYFLLVKILLFAMASDKLTRAFRTAKLPIRHASPDFNIFILLLLPAIYSAILLGYVERDDWKFKKMMMLSISVNGILSFLGVMMLNSYVTHGYSIKKILSLLKESSALIDWRALPPFILCILAFVYVMKWDHFRHNKK